MPIGKVLALDLEHTLIHDALIDPHPRPHLKGFLESVFERFAQVVLFTELKTPEARTVLNQLCEAGDIPQCAAQMPIVNWPVGGAYYEEEGFGTYKDLRYVQAMYPETALQEIMLVDDDPEQINPDQFDQWVQILPWRGNLEDRALLDINNLLWSFTAGVARRLPEAKPRIESAPLRFGEDWPGFFIRGDNAQNLINQWMLLRSQIKNEYAHVELDPLCAIPMTILDHFFEDLKRTHITHWHTRAHTEPDKP